MAEEIPLQLLAHLRAGDRAASEELCRLLLPTAEKAASTAGVPAYAVAEVANKALLQVLEKCELGLGENNLAGLLWNHATRRSLDWLRSRQRRSAREGSLDDLPAVPTSAREEPQKLAKSDMAKHRQAMKKAQAEAAKQEGVGLICLRLHMLYGVEYKHISRIWGHGPESWAFRRAQRAGRIIREALVEAHRALGFIGSEAELFEELSLACQDSPRVLRTEVRGS